MSQLKIKSEATLFDPPDVRRVISRKLRYSASPLTTYYLLPTTYYQLPTYPLTEARVTF